MAKKPSIEPIYQALATAYPGVKTFLHFETPFQLLIATILSAQCTDERVNKVTPGLFEAYPDAYALSQAPLERVEDLIKSVNFFRNKAKNCIQTAQRIHIQFNDQVPPHLEQLITLPGVGRKTANVVLGQAFDIPGITVDTHVKRVSRRLGFTRHTDAVKIEFDLMKAWPKAYWNDLSSWIIVHGRRVCKAHKPACESCFLNPYCAQKLS